MPNTTRPTTRPAFVVLVAMIVGIVFANSMSSLRPEILPVVVAALGVLLLGAILLRRHTQLQLLLVCTLSCGLGFASRSFQRISSEQSILTTLSTGAERSSVLFGTVLRQVPSGPRSDRLVIGLDSIRCDSAVFTTPSKILLAVRHLPDSIGIPIPRRGEYIKAFAVIENDTRIRNPYESPRFSQIRRQYGVEAAAFATSPFDVYIVGGIPHRSITEQLTDAFDSVRASIANRLGALFPDTVTRGIVLAVVLGDKRWIDESTTTQFRQAGLSHILVVSGFNVGIVALLVYYLLRFIGLSRLRLRILCSMIVVALYALTIGLEPSVIRALSTVELVFLALLLERKPDIGNITAATASIALVLDPSLLFDTSFQLTYGAVFALVLIAPRLDAICISDDVRENRSWRGRIRYYIYATLVSSTAVTLGLLPIMVYAFHRVSAVAIVTNLVGIPLAGLLTSLSFLLIPLSFLPPIASVYAELTGALAYCLRTLASVSGSLHWSSFPIEQPHRVYVVLYVVGLWYLIHSDSFKRFAARTIVIACAAALLLIADVPFAATVVARDGVLSVLFADVGQGDAILVHTPHGKNIMIDFGGLDHNDDAIVTQTIVPLLEAEGMTIIDHGFLTHMHVDHYGGAAAMMERYPLHSLVTSGERSSAASALALDRATRAMHIPVMRTRRGCMYDLGDSIKLYVLNPTSSEAVARTDMNHHSLVLKLCYGTTSLLFLGDIEASDESRLVNDYGTFLRSDVVKVAHHGSRYSSDPAFAELVKPAIAVVSVGEHNSFGHPARRALSVWTRSGAQVYRTDRDGAVLIHSDGNTIRRDDWRR
ncbi:MAG: DNA internalization-related competence protein ComEC/Rec2 [Bacteroidetes bacterium]|nr:DNA internalization-related competence protein ComEC/Rec2 [Bacteroidota bacterium]